MLADVSAQARAGAGFDATAFDIAFDIRTVTCPQGKTSSMLTSPKAMVAVADWAHGWAVDEVYGIDPDALNDDRLGRALDALASQVEQVVGSIGATAIHVFGLDVARLPFGTCAVRGGAMQSRQKPGQGGPSLVAGGSRRPSRNPGRTRCPEVESLERPRTCRCVEGQVRP